MAQLHLSDRHRRIWRITGRHSGWAEAGWVALAVLSLILAWAGVLVWYAIFGIWLVPYRLVRRSQRQSKLRALRHREIVSGGNHL